MKYYPVNLDIVGRERVVPVPWTESNRTNWELRYRDALTSKSTGVETAAVRSQMASAAEQDVSHAIQARESFDWKDWKKRGGRSEEVDNLAHFTTRELLVDWSNMKRDTELFMGLPPVQVDAVVAYGSYQAFKKENPLEGVDVKRQAKEDLLNLFGWEFFVPSHTKRSHEDLIKEALDMASLSETKLHRQYFHRWRRNAILSKKTPQDAQQEMESLIQDYRAAVRKTKIKTTVKYAFAVMGAAAVLLPPLGIAGAFAGLGSFVISETEKKGLPEDLKVAAMFYDARRRFGWNRRKGK